VRGKHYHGIAHFTLPNFSVQRQRLAICLTRIWLEEHRVGQLFYAPLDVIFSNFDVVEPDLLYMSNERAAQIATGQHVQGVPELVIEIGSPGTRKRDETIKRRLYERFGVTEYWVVDPDLDAVRVYRRSGDLFGRPIELSREAGDVLTTTLLPQLDLPLQRISAD
jgi:Uma2 family endonuclease